MRSPLAGIAIAAAAFAAIAVAVTRSGEGAARADLPSAAATAPVRDFVPPTRRDGRFALLPVRFPDGTAVRLRYARSLRLAQLGLRPWATARLRGCCFRTLRIVYMGRERRPPDWFATGAAPLQRFREGGRIVGELWRAPADDPAGENLILRFGPWRVVVARANGGAAMTERELGLWARNLRGTVTRSGFLVLRAKRPLSLVPFGAQSGPELSLDEGGNDVILRSGRSSSGTRASPQRSAGVATWYVPRASVTVQVYSQDRRFLEAVRRGLRIAPLRPSG